MMPAGYVRSVGRVIGLLRFLRRYAAVGWPGRAK